MSNLTYDEVLAERDWWVKLYNKLVDTEHAELVVIYRRLIAICNLALTTFEITEPEVGWNPAACHFGECQCSQRND